MKTKVLRFLATATVVGSVPWLTACQKHKHGIVFLPQNSDSHHITPENIGNIKNTLASFDEQLYFLEEFKGGKLTKADPIGKMPEILLVRPRAEVEDGADPNFNGYAIQIGCGLSEAESDFRYYRSYENRQSGQTVARKPTPTPNMPHPHLIKNIKESGDLVKEIDKILPPP